MSSEDQDEVYVDYRPVLLRRHEPRVPLWRDFILTLERVGPYSFVSVVMGFLFLGCEHYAANPTARTVLQHLQTGSLIAAAVLLVYEWRKTRRLDDGRWKKRLGNTMREVGWYCGMGVVIAGVLWVILSGSEHETKLAQEIFTHIAGAFFVSAIVIFGYEWGSEAKRAADLAASLALALSGHLRILEGSSRDALVQSLEDLIGPRHAEYLAPQLLSFAKALRQLGRVDDWAAPGYLAFIGEYHATLTENVKKLAEFTARVGAEEFEIQIPRASTIADKMINGTMLELANRGGRYYALSDAATWEALPSFRRSQLPEHRKDLSIQRIFVLGKSADDDLPLRDVASILVEHYDNARKSDAKYEIRITDSEAFADKIGSLAEAQHFGIFHPTKVAPIVISVHDKSMSRFKVRAASETMISEVASAWKTLADLHLTEVDSSAGDTILRDYLLAYSIKRLPDGSGYRGVSRIKTWQNGAFSRFLLASEIKLNRAQITIRRLLVFDEDDLKAFDALVPLLAEHESLWERTGHNYHWRVCWIGDWSPTIAEEISFGLFDDSSLGDRMVADVSLERRPFVKEIDRNGYKLYSGAFEDVWKEVGDWRASISRVFGGRAEELIRRMKPDATDRTY